MNTRRTSLSTRRVAGVAALSCLALLVLPSSCSGTDAPGGPTTVNSGAGGSTVVASMNAGSGNAPSTPAAGSDGTGVAGAIAATSGGAAGSGGGISGGTGGSSGDPSVAPVGSCPTPLPTGSSTVQNVGTAPSGITQADLAGASPSTHYYQSVPGNLPAADTTDPAKQVGLFLVFHEHGSDPSVEMPSVITALANLKRSGDFVVLGLPIDPNTTTHPYTAADHTRAKALLDYALKKWPINPRRVYLWGRGEGATMAHQWGTENKAAVAAMITYSWGWDSKNWPTNAANDQPDLYLAIGLADYPDSHVPLVRRVYQDAKNAKFNIIYREVPGLKGPTANAPTNIDAVNWAISSRHKTAALSTQEAALLAPYQDASVAQAICPDASLFANVQLVGGLAAGKVMPGLLNAGNEASRILAAQIAGAANFGDTADVALGAKLKDSSPAVRKAAIAALGVAANWRSPGAQKALIDFVSDLTRDATERGLAVDAIGAAVKFQIGGDVTTGGYQDPPLFAALVALLGDSDESLRAKAFAILKPAMNSNYDPSMAPAAQQTAITAWQTWQKSLTG